MVKCKKKRRGLVEKVNESRRKEKSEKLNPFEVKINRQKHHVFGRKLAKHNQGRPGVSRSRAIKKRKDTLLKEYRENSKSNKFIDRRIGENDTDLTVEDKMMQRFALEKKRSHAASTLYNLEKEDLTHYGQSLSEIEKFDDPIKSDDDDDIDNGYLGKSMTQELFGGFLQKKPQESQIEKKSWKERMQEMIANSKKEKFEQQSESEKIKEMTLDVDKQWKYLSLVMADCRRGRDTVEDDEGVDDYDIAVNTMKFDVTAMAADRLKTEEEIAKEELENLKKLEDDRLRRMSGVVEADASVRRGEFRSADDLDDGFTRPEERKSHHLGVRFADAGSGTDDDGDDIDDDVSADDGDESDSNEEDKENGDNEDSGEDVKSSTDDEINNKDEEKLNNVKTRDFAPRSILKEAASPLATKHVDFKKLKGVMDQARCELPFTPQAPETYAELDALLDGRPTEEKLEMVSRLRKCHHVSLDSANKQKLEKLFTFLVQYVCDMVVLDQPESATIDGLMPHLYHLCQQSPVICAESVRSLIAMRHREYSDLVTRKAGRGLYPTLDVLILLRVVPVLFPSSDYQHPVVTPALLFMLQILAQSPVKNLKDLSAGLFLCHLCLTFVHMSKRFLPEVLNYLQGCLFLAADKQPDKVEPVINPFTPVGSYIDLLHISSDQSQMTIKRPVKLSECLTDNIDISSQENDPFRLRLIDLTVQTACMASQLYTHLPSYKEIFASIVNIAKKLPTQKYPQLLQTSLNDLVTSIEANGHGKRKFLVTQKLRPQALRMYECQVEDKFDGRKKYKGKPEQKEHQKLKYLHKKEMKGAIREVKRDSQFLTRHQLDEQRQRDSQRKRKVKEIYSMLSMQEGEYNKVKREKDWGKK